MWVGIAIRIATLYVVLCALVYVFQRSLIYPAPKQVEQPRGFAGYELVEIERPGLGPVFGMYAPARAPDEGKPVEPTVVYFHGNAEQLAWQKDLAKAFFRRRLGFLALEFPGYGLMADQAISEEALVAAAAAGVEWLRETHGVTRENTVVMGRSLGSGVATELASRGLAARLIVVAPYTSIVDMGKKMLPFLPASLLVKDRFASLEKAPSIEIPVLIVHGEEDEVIPVWMGRKLGEAFPQVQLEILAEVGHNDLPLFNGSDLMKTITGFALGAAQAAQVLPK